MAYLSPLGVLSAISGEDVSPDHRGLVFSPLADKPLVSLTVFPSDGGMYVVEDLDVLLDLVYLIAVLFCWLTEDDLPVFVHPLLSRLLGKVLSIILALHIPNFLNDANQMATLVKQRLIGGSAMDLAVLTPSQVKVPSSTKVFDILIVMLSKSIPEERSYHIV